MHTLLILTQKQINRHDFHETLAKNLVSVTLRQSAIFLSEICRIQFSYLYTLLVPAISNQNENIQK